MERGAEVKVGLIVLLAALLVGYFVFAVRGRGAQGTYTVYVTFANARGLQRGNPVQLAGVKIGEVRSVGLKEGEALIELEIDRRYPLYSNYRFRVASSGLLQEVYVEVVPVAGGPQGERIAAGGTVRGEMSVDLSQLMESSQRLLERLNRTTKTLQTVLANEETAAQFQATIANLAAASQAAAELTARASEMARAAGPDVQAALHSLSRAAADMQATTGAVRTQLVEGGTLENVEEITRQAVSLTKHLDEVAAGLSNVAGNKQVQEDLRAVIADLHDTADSVRAIAADLRVVASEARKVAPTIPKTVETASSVLQKVSEISERVRPPQIQPSFDVLYNPKDSRSFSSGRLDLSWAEPRFLRIGIDDIGETSTANIQVGERKGRRALRYGLVRSRLGIGLDVPLLRRGTLQVDLFDPNRPRVDALAGWPLVEGRTDMHLLVGARDLGEDPLLVGGIRFTR